MSIKTICNLGCGEQFTTGEMMTAQLDGGIEKTFFTCPHCQHEYVAFYTDDDIRNLQAGIRKTLSKRVNPRFNLAAAIRREKEIMNQVDQQKKIIAEKMEALRKRVEGNKKDPSKEESLEVSQRQQQPEHNLR